MTVPPHRFVDLAGMIVRPAAPKGNAASARSQKGKPALGRICSRLGRTCSRKAPLTVRQRALANAQRPPSRTTRMDGDARALARLDRLIWTLVATVAAIVLAAPLVSSFYVAWPAFVAPALA